uniref:RNA polymerase II transcription factor B subunit 4 n=1 Tax=Rhizochromulina marina TaxID=1034831 RepID=A0A6U0YPM0_9STRA
MPGGESLHIIVDTNPATWRSRNAAGKLSLDELVQALLVFTRVYLLLDRRNEVKIVATAPGTNQEVFSSTSFDDLAAVNLHANLLSQVKELVDSLDMERGRASDGPSAPGAMRLAAALSKTLCVANRSRRRDPTMSLRVLIIQASPDYDSEYNAVMNCTFACQTMGCMVDSCLLAEDPSNLLQQATDLTGGAYTHLCEPGPPVLQQLLLAFLPSTSERAILKLPVPSTVDYSASCFDYNCKVDQAYVCSVCLAIYRDMPAVCPTCQSPVRNSSQKSRLTSAGELEGQPASSRAAAAAVSLSSASGSIARGGASTSSGTGDGNAASSSSEQPSSKKARTT